MSDDEFKVDGLTVRIKPDPDPCNPRKEYDHLGTMVCWHRRYNLGDEQPKESSIEWWQRKMFEMHPNIPDDISAQNVMQWKEKHYCEMRLYLMDHSGLSMSTGSFNCPWDSGPVGFICVSLEKARKEYGLQNWTDIYEPTGLTLYQQCEKVLVAEVKVYDQYLTGDVWVYDVKDETGKILDSLGWCYGYEYCKKEATETAKAIAARLAKVIDYQI